MGKVRISVVKRTARKLLALYPNVFTPEFQHNKELVTKFVTVKSKKLRNQIAGYITHLIKLKQRQESPPSG